MKDIFWDGIKFFNIRRLFGLSLEEMSDYLEIPVHVLDEHEKNKYARDYYIEIDEKMNYFINEKESMLSLCSIEIDIDDKLKKLNNDKKILNDIINYNRKK